MAHKSYESVVLVTGFPSFLAKKLVLHLVRSEPDTLIYAVVLPKLIVEARHVIDSLDLADRQRVVVIEGDAAAIDLGLSGAELRQLSSEVDRIHHVAHASYIGVDRGTAEALNIRGAGEITLVAKLMTDLKCLVHHSTSFVCGDRRGTVYEEDACEGVSYRNIIEETRAHGERVVRRASRDLPVAIVRPSMVVGASGTGDGERLDLPYLFILLLLAAPADLALPIGPRADSPLHIVPVDFVVQASTAIGRDPRSPGRTFHLVDPAPVRVHRFVQMIHEIRQKRAAWVELSTLARSVLLAPGIEGYLRNPKTIIDQILSNVRFDSRNADLVLGSSGISCPPLETYVSKLVTAVEERLLHRKAETAKRDDLVTTDQGQSREQNEGDPSEDADAMD